MFIVRKPKICPVKAKIHCIKIKIGVNNFARKQGVKNEKILYVERRRSKKPF